MKEVFAYLEETIKDHVLVKSEKRTLKSLINNKNLSERELQVIRAKIYEIARNNEGQIPTNQLIDWIEMANKLTLTDNGTTSTPSSRVYFSPGDQCRDAIIHQIRLADNQLDICLFTISDDLIGMEIAAAHRNGKQVRVITDDEKVFDYGSDIRAFKSRGIPVKVDDASGHMHHKFCIVDNSTVITGSYNWTRSASEKNYENVLLNTEVGIVNSYSQEFNRLWNDLKEF